MAVCQGSEDCSSASTDGVFRLGRNEMPEMTSLAEMPVKSVRVDNALGLGFGCNFDKSGTIGSVAEGNFAYLILDTLLEEEGCQSKGL